MYTVMYAANVKWATALIHNTLCLIRKKGKIVFVISLSHFH